MKKVAYLAGIIGAFAGGIVFVLSCGHGMTEADAQIEACTDCEPKLTAARVYQVVNSDTQIKDTDDDNIIVSEATCNEGDVLLGGGCWIHDRNAIAPDDSARVSHFPLQHGPIPAVGAVARQANTYSCRYEDKTSGGTGGADVFITATAICFNIE
jgi:hypothetical protein